MQPWQRRSIHPSSKLLFCQRLIEKLLLLRLSVESSIERGSDSLDACSQFSRQISSELALYRYNV